MSYQRWDVLDIDLRAVRVSFISHVVIKIKCEIKVHDLANLLFPFIGPWGLLQLVVQLVVITVP